MIMLVSQDIFTLLLVISVVKQSQWKHEFSAQFQAEMIKLVSDGFPITDTKVNAHNVNENSHKCDHVRKNIGKFKFTNNYIYHHIPG
jgi:hypothetical protein